MKIVIFGVNILKALNNVYVGGAEKQMALLAKTLVSLKHDVSVVEPFTGEKKVEKIDGVKIVQAWDSSKGIPAMRALSYRIPSLYKIIKGEKPEFIYVRGAGIYNALVAFLFHRSTTKFIWGIAHDHDLQPKIKKNNNATLYSILTNHLMFKLSTKILFHYADLIICQTKEQENFLRNIRKVGRIDRIPNICETQKIKKQQGNDKYCLWVGKFSGSKGEEDFLLLSEMMPYMNFIAVGHVTDDFKNTAIYDNICNQTNIKCVGRLHHNELIPLYQKAFLLVHTASAEGFSNVFLEAWSLGIPVVSLHVDPDKLLQEKGLGYFSAGDIRVMKNQIERLANDPILQENISAKSVYYVTKNHAAAVIGAKFNTLLIELISVN